MLQLAVSFGCGELLVGGKARRDATSAAAQPAVTFEGNAAKAALVLELCDPVTIAGHLGRSLAEDVCRHERASEEVMRDLEREEDVPHASTQPSLH